MGREDEGEQQGGRVCIWEDLQGGQVCIWEVHLESEMCRMSHVCAALKQRAEGL